MKLWYEFSFMAAHAVAGVERHIDEFRVRVVLQGRLPDDGIVMWYEGIADVAWYVRRKLHGQELGTIVDNPTHERIARYLWREFEARLGRLLDSVEVQDSAMSGCSYDRSDAEADAP